MKYDHEEFEASGLLIKDFKGKVLGVLVQDEDGDFWCLNGDECVCFGITPEAQELFPERKIPLPYGVNDRG